MRALFKWLRLLNYLIGVSMIGLLLIDSNHDMISLGLKMKITVSSALLFVLIEVIFLLMPEEEVSHEGDDDILDT